MLMLGCPLLITAQTRIVLGVACMRGQMISVPSTSTCGLYVLGEQQPSFCQAGQPNVEPLSRHMFRVSSDLVRPSVTPEELEENVVVILLATMLGPQLGSSWHGAEFSW